MKKIPFFLGFVIFFFFSCALYAYDGITFYGAEISQSDRFNSDGQRLTTVSDILRQDRANYYVYGKPNKHDQPDDYFTTKAHRDIFDSAKIIIDPKLAQEIIYSNQPVLISVFVYSPTEIHIEPGLPDPHTD